VAKKNWPTLSALSPLFAKLLNLAITGRVLSLSYVADGVGRPVKRWVRVDFGRPVSSAARQIDR